MSIELDIIKKVTVNPGEVLVIRPDRVLSQQERIIVRDAVKAIFDQGNRVMVLEPGMSIEVIEFKDA